MVVGRVSDLYYPDDCHIGEITAAAAAGLYLSGRYGHTSCIYISDEIDATRKAQPKDIRHNMMCGMMRSIFGMAGLLTAVTRATI